MTKKNKPPKTGTEYGFSRPAEGEDTEKGRAALPLPASVKRGPAPPERNDDSAPFLRRVDGELAQPMRLSAGTQSGRALSMDEGAADPGLEAPVRPPMPVPEDAVPPPLFEPPVLSASAQLLPPRRNWLLIAIIAGGALAILCVAIILLTRNGDAPQPPKSAVATAPAKRKEADPPAQPEKIDTPKPAPPAKISDPPSPAIDDHALEPARVAFSQGNCKSAASMIQALLAKAKGGAGAHYLLGRASSCAKRYPAAIAAYGEALRLDQKRYRADVDILQDLRFLATRGPKTALAAVQLAARMSDAAQSVLVDASTREEIAIRHAAIKALIAAGADKKIDQVTALWLDIRQLSSCELRKGALQKLIPLKDPRVKKLLKQARTRRNACAHALIDAALTAP